MIQEAEQVVDWCKHFFLPEFEGWLERLLKKS